jgi:hypothetical protein
MVENWFQHTNQLLVLQPLLMTPKIMLIKAFTKTEEYQQTLAKTLKNINVQ